MHSKRLLINETNNMRDLGGYLTTNGKITKYGQFIRSDLPDKITPEGIEFLKKYGIRTIIDLRSEYETTARPGLLKTSGEFNWMNFSFTDDFTHFGRLDYCPKDHLVPTLKGVTKIAEIFNAIAEAPEGGIIFHCTAGKDRTGITAAALLLLANVQREDIIADYEVTYIYIRSRIEERKSSPDRPNELCRTEPEWIEPTLDYFEQEGGIENYLINKGVSAENLKKIKNRFVTDYKPFQ